MSRAPASDPESCAKAEPFVTVHVPMRFSRRSGRKLVLVPGGSAERARGVEVRTSLSDDPVLKAVVRAFRWKAQLDAGERASAADIARVEKLDRRYVGRVLQLTLLSRQVVELVVDAGVSPALSLERLFGLSNASWAQQDAITSGNHTRGKVGF